MNLYKLKTSGAGNFIVQANSIEEALSRIEDIRNIAKEDYKDASIHPEYKKSGEEFISNISIVGVKEIDARLL